MKKVSTLLLVAVFLAVCSVQAQQGKIKVIADQDSAGPQGTDFLSLLMLLRAPQIDLLGITTVSGDQWVDPETVYALWATQLTKRTDVPVVKGAEFPLVRTRAWQKAWESIHGHAVGGSFDSGFFLQWHGALNPDAPDPSATWAPPGFNPQLHARPGRAADFIAATIRANPGQVILYCAGPLTNIALAVRMDPGIVPLTKAIYIMGGSAEGGNELNWWFDPDAASIVLHQPWKKIVVGPGEVGMQVISSPQLMQRVVDAGGPLAAYVKKFCIDYHPPHGTQLASPMWDELMVAYLLDPSVITKTATAYLDVDTAHGPKYGDTVVWAQPSPPNFFMPYSGPNGVDEAKWRPLMTPPPGLHPATVQLKVNVKRFEDIFVDVMSH